MLGVNASTTSAKVGAGRQCRESTRKPVTGKAFERLGWVTSRRAGPDRHVSQAPIQPMSKSRPLQLIKPAASADGPEPGSAAERSLLVEAARRGDVRAFAELVDAYYARCLRFA